MSNERITIDDHEITAETDKAFGLWDGRSRKGYGAEKMLVWVPKQTLDGRVLCEKIGENMVTMPEWLALKKGLI